MNRIFSIFIVTLFMATITNAQAISYFGVKTGVISSKYEYKILGLTYDSFYNDIRIGPTMGLFLRYLDYDYFDIESELAYLQKGGEEKIKIRTLYTPDYGDYIVNDIHFDYLQFHTSIRPKTILYNIGFYGLAGFSLNYLLQVRNAFKNINDFNRIIFAYTLGTGIELINIVSIPISIEFMLNNDMTEVYDESGFKFKSYLFRIVFNM